MDYKTRKPTHPGIAFKTLVLDELELTITQAANHLNVSRKQLSEVINGKARLSTEMAKRWGKYTDTSTASWLNMQVQLDLWEVENSDVAENVRPYRAA